MILSDLSIGLNLLRSQVFERDNLIEDVIELDGVDSSDSEAAGDRDEDTSGDAEMARPLPRTCASNY